MIEIDGEGRIEGLSAANRGPSPAALLHGKSGLKSRNNSFSDMVGSITSCASQESCKYAAEKLNQIQILYYLNSLQLGRWATKYKLAINAN